MGTPDSAVPTLRRCVEDGHEVLAVWTQPDRPAGRGNRLKAPPVKEYALSRGLTVHQPSKIRTEEALSLFTAREFDVAVVVAYGRILPPSFLRAARRGAINVHFSLLPKYRGAAPVNWAIVRGETVSGVTTMLIDEGLDTGPVLLQRPTPVGEEETAPQLLERLSHETNGLSTHAYDAVDDAVRLLVRKAPSTRDHRLMKKAVVVVTDGFPVGDVVSPATVIERANEAEVSVYTVTLPSYSRLLSASAERAPLPTPLDVSGLVEKTGGANVYATTKDYEPLFRALAEEVTSTYVLAFYPPEEKRRDGRPHTIRVEAPRGLSVRQNRTELKAATSDK